MSSQRFDDDGYRDFSLYVFTPGRRRAISGRGSTCWFDRHSADRCKSTHRLQNGKRQQGLEWRQRICLRPWESALLLQNPVSARYVGKLCNDVRATLIVAHSDRRQASDFVELRRRRLAAPFGDVRHMPEGPRLRATGSPEGPIVGAASAIATILTGSLGAELQICATSLGAALQCADLASSWHGRREYVRRSSQPSDRMRLAVSKMLCSVRDQLQKGFSTRPAVRVPIRSRDEIRASRHSRLRRSSRSSSKARQGRSSRLGSFARASPLRGRPRLRRRFGFAFRASIAVASREMAPQSPRNQRLMQSNSEKARENVPHSMPFKNQFVGPCRGARQLLLGATRTVPEPDNTLRPHACNPGLLLRAFCSSHAPSDTYCKKRYVEISEFDEQLQFFIEEQGLMENVFGPLRQAKTNYILGNYVGSIALCGIVAEKMAILIYRMNKPNSTKLEDFDKEYSQAKRIRVLQEESLIEDNSAEDFDYIREARRSFLHHWLTPEEGTAEQTLRAYAAAIRLVLVVVDYKNVDGRLILNSKFMKFLDDRGATTDIKDAE